MRCCRKESFSHSGASLQSRASAHEIQVVFVDLRDGFKDDFLAVEAIRPCPSPSARDHDVMLLNIVGMSNRSRNGMVDVLMLQKAGELVRSQRICICWVLRQWIELQLD